MKRCIIVRNMTCKIIFVNISINNDCCCSNKTWIFSYRDLLHFAHLWTLSVLKFVLTQLLRMLDTEHNNPGKSWWCLYYDRWAVRLKYSHRKKIRSQLVGYLRHPGVSTINSQFLYESLSCGWQTSHERKTDSLLAEKSYGEKKEGAGEWPPIRRIASCRPQTQLS